MTFALVLSAAAILVSLYIVGRYFPFLHVGKPANNGTVTFNERREILTTKSGGQKQPTGMGRIVQQLAIRWWIGASSPRKPKWFIGFIRWDSATPTDRSGE
ncbi:MAG TPA: hypothetical protein VHW02_07665 [Rhizomicrobium sp.]|nr:hypothetical protein [Rhizomicrobium sp.]